LPKIAVIADDLTGANDTGVQFAEMGFSAISLMNETFASDLPANADVWVVNTETRSMQGEQAYHMTGKLRENLGVARRSPPRRVDARRPITRRATPWSWPGVCAKLPASR